MKPKFLKCEHCGNVVEVVYESGVPLMCCGKNVKELLPNTSEGAGEKHLPIVNVDKDVVHVKVGEVPHPMQEEHSIQWIYVETENGSQKKVPKQAEEPSATFHLGNEKPISVYEYCNLHGLWKTDLNSK